MTSFHDVMKNLREKIYREFLNYVNWFPAVFIWKNLKKPLNSQGFEAEEIDVCDFAKHIVNKSFSR